MKGPQQGRRSLWPLVIVLLSHVALASSALSFSYDFTNTATTLGGSSMTAVATGTPAALATSVSVNVRNPDGTTNSTSSYAQTLRMTTKTANLANAVWYNTAIDVTKGFNTSFSIVAHDPTVTHAEACRVNAGVNAHCVTRGGDGVAFVLQADSRGTSAVGESGGHLGYGGDTSGIEKSYAIEFDTWYNHEFLDAGFSHVAVHSKGQARNSGDTRYAVGYHAITPDLADGKRHNITIRLWPGFTLLNDDFVSSNFIQTEYGMTKGTIFSDNGMNTLEVYVDDMTSPVLTTAVNILDSIGTPMTYMGFTSSTGQSYQYHEILNWAFDQA